MVRGGFSAPGGSPVKPWAAQERSGAKYAASPENLQRDSGSGIRRNGETGILPSADLVTGARKTAARSRFAQFGGGRRPGRYS
jgi:hypothetical protein